MNHYRRRDYRQPQTFLEILLELISVSTDELKAKKCPFFDVHGVELLCFCVRLGEEVGGDLLGKDGAELGLDDGIGHGGVGLPLGGRPQVTRVIGLEVRHVEDEAAGLRGGGGGLQQLRGGEGQVWLEAAQARRPGEGKMSFLTLLRKVKTLHRLFIHPTDNITGSIGDDCHRSDKDLLIYCSS